MNCFISPVDNVIKKIAIKGLGKSVPGTVGLVNLERDHDDGALVASLGGLHDAGRQGPPQLVRVEPHQTGGDVEAALGLVRHPAPAPVVVRIVLETDVSKMEDGCDGCVDRHFLSLGYS